MSLLLLLLREIKIYNTTMLLKSDSSLMNNLLLKGLFIFVFILSNNSFSQKIGQGELLSESNLEEVIKKNINSGLDPNNNIFINHHFKMNISEKKISDKLLIESISTLQNVLDVSVFEDNLIVVTKKGIDILPSVKQQLSYVNIKLISDRKLIYKSK